MRQIFLSISLLAAVILAGCKENQTETTDEAPAEVTARLCHIARIGNLAEIPEELWENDRKPESTELPEGLDFSGKLQEAPVAKSVGEEVDPDVLAIVESTARESSTKEGLQKAQEKEDELNLVIEMVEENQKTDSEVEEMFQKKGQKAKISAEDEGDENEEVAIPMGNEDEDVDGIDEEFGEEDAEQDVKKASSGKKKTKAGQNRNVKLEEEAEDGIEEGTEEEAEEGTEEDSEEDSKEDKVAKKPEGNAEEAKAKAGQEKSAGMKSGVLDEEVERQAEEFLKILKNTPKEVREELKNAHFQNVTYRLVKVPGVIMQENMRECLIVRTMEYTGTNLARDYQMLNLSKNYSSWLMEQEKYLEIMTLDSLHHETWVEVPEFWNSSEE